MAALFPLIIVLALGAVLVMSQRRRSRDAQAIQHNLAVGAQIMTTSGLFGTVVGLHDDAIELEVADGVVLRYARAAVGRVVTPPATDDNAPTEQPAEDEPADGVSDGASESDSGSGR